MFTLIAIKNNVVDSEKELFKIIEKFDYFFENELIRTNAFSFQRKDLENENISKNISLVSSYDSIRGLATNIFKEISKNTGILLEGRDIGTVVMPNADFKFFLKVDAKVAAERRLNFYRRQNNDISFEEIYQNIIKRNKFDSTRKIAPLTPSEDAIIIDTTNYTINKIVDKIMGIIKGNGQEV